jgi:hypothetical protein
MYVFGSFPLTFVRNNANAFDPSGSVMAMLPIVDFGPPSPEALAWKSTSAGYCSIPLHVLALMFNFRDGFRRS